MKILRERLEADFAALGRIGSLENGGFSRIAFSTEDMAAREWLQQAMRDAGLTVSIDAVGNMRGRREGRENLAPVLLGSHLDTVPEGGNYDGVVGVLAALEVVRALNDAQVVTDRPIEVINFSAEESSRFGVATIGSKALTGKLPHQEKLIDRNGKYLKKILKEIGYLTDNNVDMPRDKEAIHAFLELHIEQGPVLEQQGCPIGIVTAIAAPTRFHVTIEGRADHSGNTPMNMRRDALVAASELVLGVEQIAAKEAGDDTVATVGYLEVTPGAMNVVPGRVELGIDIRDISMADKDGAVQAALELLKKIQADRQVTIAYEQLCDDAPVRLADNIIDLLEESAQELKLSYRKMPSGAGHDAMNMASITAAGMIFIPSVGGVSHNINEYSRMEDICTGVELLLKAAVRLCQA